MFRKQLEAEYQEEYQIVEEHHEKELSFSNQTPFTWGLKCIDSQLGKPTRADLIVFAGYPGIGKTEYSYFMARKNAIMGNKTTFITLELPTKQMIERYVFKVFGYNKIRSQTEEIPKEIKDKMKALGNKLLKMENLAYKSPKSSWDINELESIIRTQYQDGHKLFFIDNLGKISGDSNENTRFEQITSRLQDLKNDLEICIILVHHLKKPTEQNKNKQGGVGSFRGSQKVIDNATQVVEIRRDKEPEFLDEETRAAVLFFQYKDTWFGNTGMGTIYFYDGEYHEQYTPLTR